MILLHFSYQVSEYSHRMQYPLSFMPIFVWGLAGVAFKLTDKVFAAVVADVCSDIDDTERCVPQKLFCVFHPDISEELNERLSGCPLDQAGGILRGIVKFTAQ